MSADAEGFFGALIKQGLQCRKISYCLEAFRKLNFNSFVQLVSHAEIGRQCRDNLWGNRRIQIQW